MRDKEFGILVDLETFAKYDIEQAATDQNRLPSGVLESLDVIECSESMLFAQEHVNS